MARDRSGGQILPLFALAMVVILALGALLVDGASALVTRRRLQNVGDAAALAGANVLQASGTIHVCSTVATEPPGAPRQDIIDAVMASLATNWPAITASQVTITCAAGWENQAVRVDLRLNSATFLSGAIGMSAPSVATTSTAVNGQLTGSTYSVVLLDPANAGWPNGRRGCPAFLISGGPTLQFDGSVFVNSACTAANGGAMATNGNSATVTISAGRSIKLVGGFDPGPLTITPAPTTGATMLEDPLAGLEPIAIAGMTVRSSSRLVLNNVTQVLQPGIYSGGIQLRNSSVALLRPGIYVLDGGGLDIGAQASFCSISATSSATTCAGFATDCPDTTCGILLYNKGTASGSGAMGQITVGAGATLKLRAYDERANANQFFEYRNLLIWQSVSPAPSSTYAQPVVQLNGGGNVDISGTLYAPSAKVLMGGTSGGTGGGSVDLLLQFISWDLEMSGNSSFHYFYSDDAFARPKDYGLVQ
ncbi:MAG TPA: pilus assembly protein TadG-related protein [Candidatus Limnocylindrales bacterium]|nr:pilus assembly protein TadG-related protein [Candidatus Limnocylindrales bacterium]